MKKQILFSLLLSVLVASSAFSQQINLTNPTMTPVEAIEDILLGAGINAFNITYNGSAANANVAQNSVRSFNSGTSNFPIAEGVLLNTYQSPTVSDPDLNSIVAPEVVENGVIIEFDFVPSGNTLSFNYIFASSEYSSFTCSQFNDVFGFFISGPGINGPYSNNSMNIATVPNSTVPVGINTVNSGSVSFGLGNNATYCSNKDPNWQANSVYFTSSYNTAYGSVPHFGSFLLSTPLNGSTVVLPANASLSCSDTFHIKLAIANTKDDQYDSAVFLEANSFASEGGGIDIAIQASNSASDTLLIEGCSQAEIYVTRPSGQSTDSLIVYFEVGGTATEGVDYPVLAPGDSLIFVPGNDTLVLNINPVSDGINEGPESITISTYAVNACGDSIKAEGVIWVVDAPYSTVASTDTIIYCANDSVPLWATTTNGIEPYTYSWSNGEVGDSVFGSVLTNGTHEFIVTSTDACGFEFVDTAIVVLDQRLKIDSLVQVSADCGMSNGSVVGYGDPTSYTGTPVYTWTGPGANNPSSINASAWQNRPPGWYYFTITDDVCSVSDSILVQQNAAPTASFTADPMIGSSPLNVTFTNTSDPATTYDWDFGNGQSNSVNNLSNQQTTYLDEGSYTVTLTLTEGGCTDQATKVITVLLPLSYDTPNIFTPNGDNENDFFTINAKNASALEVVILNRWGNVVFESEDLNFKWNGSINNSGAECTDGTYFYVFKLTNSAGEQIEEHGFVQLVRSK
ncbi:MAG TPA: choice-of-anchor L domain-containing protein [Brumimicrobium sp.]|nr:choice-of-anchor L domain-containing protein [Brumimicrobium sp.]